MKILKTFVHALIFVYAFFSINLASAQPQQQPSKPPAPSQENWMAKPLESERRSPHTLPETPKNQRFIPSSPSQEQSKKIYQPNRQGPSK